MINVGDILEDDNGLRYFYKQDENGDIHYRLYFRVPWANNNETMTQEHRIRKEQITQYLERSIECGAIHIKVKREI